MARDDDPEARIRDLERSLGHQARGTRPGTARVMLVVGAALAVAAIAVVVGLVTFYTHRSSDTDPTVSASGTPSEPAAQSTQSTRPSAASGTTTVPEHTIETQNPATPTNGGLFVVSTSGTFACNDRATIVTGVSLDVVLTGHCASVRVTTKDTKVTVDSADTINIAGDNNEVVYHSGTPNTGTIGNGNVIHQG